MPVVLTTILSALSVMGAAIAAAASVRAHRQPDPADLALLGIGTETPLRLS